MKRIQAAALGKIAAVQTLVSTVHSVDPKLRYERGLAERELVTTACFLKMFIALEEFFEASFAHYATGRMSTERWRPSKYARPPSLDHAHAMLTGTQRWVDWSTPEKIIKLADLFFVAGEPFQVPVKSSYEHLMSMKTVRNSTAHNSRTTQAALDGLHTRWTAVPAQGVTTYKMLLATNATTADTFYQASESTVTTLINQISSFK